jgi:hypothetical protein
MKRVNFPLTHHSHATLPQPPREASPAPATSTTKRSRLFREAALVLRDAASRLLRMRALSTMAMEERPHPEEA